MPDFRQRPPASAVTLGRALVDDADHADRHAHARRYRARSAASSAPSPRRPDRAGRRYPRKPLAIAAHAGLVERQPVDESRVAALGARRLDILRVGREDLARCRFDASAMARSAAFFLGGARRKRARQPRGRAVPYRASSARGSLQACRQSRSTSNSSACSTMSSRWISSSRPRKPRILDFAALAADDGLWPRRGHRR